MSDFTLDSRFNVQAGFNKVRVGGDSPILEVELNEIQDIQNSKRQELAKTVLRDGIDDVNTISLVVASTNVTVTISNAQLFLDGHLLNVDSLEKLVADGETLYVKMKEVVLDYTDTIKEYGNQQDPTSIANTMLEARYGAESSRRVQTTFDLTVDNTDTSYDYLTIGSNSSGVFTSTVNNFSNKLDPSKFYGVSSGGTDAYAITTDFGYPNYKVGMIVTLKADVNNTGASTCNVDSVSVKNLKVFGDAGKRDTVTGDIVAGGTYRLMYDGTDLVIISQVKADPKIQIFTTNGTFTAPFTGYYKVTVCGGGGGGSSVTSSLFEGGGGGGGGTAEKIVQLTKGEAVPVTVGAGGIQQEVPGDPGNNGDPSSFGTYCTGNGGSGGVSGYYVGVGGSGGSGVDGTPAGNFLSLAGHSGNFSHSGGSGFPYFNAKITGSAKFGTSYGWGSISVAGTSGYGQVGGDGIVTVEWVEV